MQNLSAVAERPERTGQPIPANALGIVEQPLTLRERAWNHGGLRKTLLLLLLALAWEGYARWVNNPLLVPTFSATLQAFWERSEEHTSELQSLS
jgi:NitT/TauT family transport system permease protein